jgi:predicted acylesterase/phospholipase RssA
MTSRTLKMRALKTTHRSAHRPPYEYIALLLQGGGALGAYQAGVYEALTEADGVRIGRAAPFR